MDIKEVFNEVRTRFSLLPQFQELECELKEMERRISRSFVKKSRAHLSCDERSGTHLATPWLQEPLPPPIPRPTGLEMLLHHAPTFQVWEMERKGEKSINGETEHCGFKADDSVPHCRDYLCNKSSSHHLERTPKSGTPNIGTTAVSVPCSARECELRDLGVGPHRCYIPKKRDNVSYTEDMQRLQTDTKTHHGERRWLDSGTDFRAGEEVGSQGGQPGCDTYSLLKDLDETSILRHVRRTLRVYKCQKGKEKEHEKCIKDSGLCVDANREEVVSNGIAAMTSPSARETERALRWSPGNGMRTATGAARSILAAELDHLEKSHHSVFAELLKEESKALNVQTQISLPVTVGARDSALCAPMSSALGGFRPHLNSISAETFSSAAVGAAGVGAEESDVFPTLPKKKFGLMQGAGGHREMDERTIDMRKDPCEWERVNTPIFKRMHSVVPAPTPRSSTLSPDA